jgi:hypothetical protein
MQGKSTSDQRIEQEKRAINLRMAEFKIKFNSAPSHKEKNRLIEGLFKQAQQGFSIKGVSQDARQYGMDQVKQFREQYQDQVLQKIRRANQALKPLQQVVKAQVKPKPQPQSQSFFAGLVSGIGGLIKNALDSISKLFTQSNKAVGPSPSRPVIGAAPNILGKQAGSQLVTDGSPVSYAQANLAPKLETVLPVAATSSGVNQSVLGPQVAQEVMDKLEIEAAEAFARDYGASEAAEQAADNFEFAAELEHPEYDYPAHAALASQSTDDSLSFEQASMLNDAIDEAGQSFERDGAGLDLASSIGNTVAEVRETSRDVAAALKGPLSIPGSTLSGMAENLKGPNSSFAKGSDSSPGPD